MEWPTPPGDDGSAPALAGLLARVDHVALQAAYLMRVAVRLRQQGWIRQAFQVVLGRVVVPAVIEGGLEGRALLYSEALPWDDQRVTGFGHWVAAVGRETVAAASWPILVAGRHDDPRLAASRVVARFLHLPLDSP